MAKIIINREAIHYSLSQYIAWMLIFLLFPICLYAEEIHQRGDAFVIYLSGDLNFDEVVKNVEIAVLGENWQIVDELDIGAAVKELDKHTENTVLSVCKLQYLAQAIEEDPLISLIIPCRFTVFRETVENTEEDRIVVGFYDPVAEANGLNLKQARAAELATTELKAVLQRVAEIYQE